MKPSTFSDAEMADIFDAQKTAKELKRASVYLGLMRAFPFAVPSGSH